MKGRCSGSDVCRGGMEEIYPFFRNYFRDEIIPYDFDRIQNSPCGYIKGKLTDRTFIVRGACLAFRMAEIVMVKQDQVNRLHQNDSDEYNQQRVSHQVPIPIFHQRTIVF